MNAGAVLLLLADNLRLRSWLNEYEWRLRLETVAHNEWKAAVLAHRCVRRRLTGGENVLKSTTAVASSRVGVQWR